MNKFIVTFTLSFLFNSYVYSDELNCGSLIFKDALSHEIYAQVDKLNTGFITKEEINQIPVKISKHVTQAVQVTGGFRCLANVEVGIDKRVVKNLSNVDLHYDPSARIFSDQYFPDYYRTVLADGVISQHVIYDANLKNDTEAVINIFEPNMVSATIYAIAWFAKNADDIAQNIEEGKYQDVIKNYNSADSQLNAIWDDFSETAKQSLKSDARKWILEKNRICGNVDDLNNNHLPLSEKIPVYECQTKMTLQRIDALSSQ